MYLPPMQVPMVFDTKAYKEGCHAKHLLPSLIAMQAKSLLSDPKWMAWRDPDTNDCIMHVVARDSPVMLARLLKTTGGQALKEHVNFRNHTPLYAAVLSGQLESVRNCSTARS